MWIRPRPDRGRRPALAAAIVGVLAISSLLVACEGEDEEDGAAFANGLLVLSGEIGSMSLRVVEDGDPGGRELDLPDGTTTWVAAGRTNVLVATTVDGRSFVSGPLGNDDPDWRLVEPVTTADVPPEPPLYFGTWDPAGGAYAQLAADFAAGGLRVVVVDPALEGASEAAFNQVRAQPVPPAWIDDDRVAVVTGSATTPAVLVVDTPSGGGEAGPSGIALVATSADASVAAAWRGPGQPVTVQPTGDFLEGASPVIRIDPPEPGWNPGALALDGAGRRLAVLWLAGDAVSDVTIHAADRDWARVTTIDVAAVQAASIGWLR